MLPTKHHIAFNVNIHDSCLFRISPYLLSVSLSRKGQKSGVTYLFHQSSLDLLAPTSRSSALHRRIIVSVQHKSVCSVRATLSLLLTKRRHSGVGSNHISVFRRSRMSLHSIANKQTKSNIKTTTRVHVSCALPPTCLYMKSHFVACTMMS
jgi:hypothetical protein